MSNLVCPECGSTNIMTERRVNGYHVCLECHNFWSNGVKPTLTVFQQITQSPEVLAEYCVYECGDIYGDGYPVWYSSVTKIYYAEKAEAIAATVARLKEVAE